MLRFIISIIVVIFDFIFAIPLFIISSIIRLFSKKASDGMNRIIIKIYMYVLGFISGAKITYKGLDNIPKDKAVLYVGNHSSFFDVILTYPHLQGNCGYIAKKEFEKVPILSQAMKFIYCLFLDRHNLKDGLKTILKAIDYVNDGISIFIFPEGTRSKDGKMNEFKEGSMKVATKTGCPIIPVAISNTSAIFEDHLPLIKAVPVVIEFMEPVDVSALSKEEQKGLGKKLHDMIEERRDANYEEIGIKI